MMGELLIRFMVGGLVVSGFAMLSDVFRPKSFAGLFGAAPSVALATVVLTIAHDGKAYAALEARSMVLGALAFLLYAALVSWALMHYKRSAGHYHRAAAAVVCRLCRIVAAAGEAPMSRVQMNPGAVKQSRPHEYALRFLFGGVSTVLAWGVARRFGPTIGGLFLAFPAIFPASASLIETHERERKAKAGLDGLARARTAASVDAAGASLGAIGLMGFAVVLRLALERSSAAMVLPAAMVVWAGLSWGAWMLRKGRLLRRGWGLRTRRSLPMETAKRPGAAPQH